MSIWDTLASTMAVVSRTLTYATGLSFLALAILSPRSRRARLYLNVAAYVGSLGVCSVWGVMVSIVLSLIPGQRLKINKVVARSFYLLAGTLTGIRFEVEGEHHFAQARPAVLVGNHQTGIDILYLGRIFPNFASIMAKQELKYAPLLGQYMLLSGAVFVNRKNRHDAIKAFSQVGDDMKRKKLSLWVFPEGTRSNLPFPDLLPFKKGAFHLAVQSGVPIVPVVCENYWRLFDGKSRFEGGTIRIKVLPPIPTKDLTADDVTELTTRVRTQMLEVLQQMDRDRDAFDVSSSAAHPPSSTGSASGSVSVPSNRANGPEGLGGIAGWMARIVGTGSGHDYTKRAERQSEALKKPGTSGERPEDYGLVPASEGEKGSGAQPGAEAQPMSQLPPSGSAAEEQLKESATASGAQTGGSAGEGLAQRKQKDGSGSSEELDDDGAVMVKRPEGTV